MEDIMKALQASENSTNIWSIYPPPDSKDSKSA